jgi:hypothetical protein
MAGWLPILRKYTNGQYDGKKINCRKESTFMQVQRTTNTDAKCKRRANKQECWMKKQRFSSDNEHH